MRPREIRTLVTESPAASDGKLNGLAAPFNKVTTIGAGKFQFREKVAPGAFAKSINDGDVVLLDNHDQARPIARMSAGTLRLSESARGAEWDADPADTSYARDLAANVKAGNYGGCSFGFEVIRDSWATGDDGVEERTLHEVKLHEISVVTFPAYGGTLVNARSAYDAAMEARGPKPYGDVEYADPKNGKYPIDTKEHAKAAWDYINMPKNAEMYPLNGVTLADVKSRIMAACKKFGVTTSEQNAADAGETRDDPDGREYAVIDSAVKLLKAGKAEGALALLQHEQANRDSDNDGDTDSAPADGDKPSRSEPKPDLPTSEDAARRDALRRARMRDLSR